MADETELVGLLSDAKTPPLKPQMNLDPLSPEQLSSYQRSTSGMRISKIIISYI